MNKTLFIILLSFSIISCKKEGNTNNEQTPVSNDTTLIDTSRIEKIIGLDTTKMAPYDTTYTLVYQYDNLDRVIKLSYLDYNNTGAFDNLNNISETQTNSYLNNDSLPYMSEFTSTSVNKPHNFFSFV